MCVCLLFATQADTMSKLSSRGSPADDVVVSLVSQGDSPDIDTSLVMMPGSEVQKLRDLLSRTRIASGGRLAYLEYGSGGSTTEFTKYASVAVSIEHDTDWCNVVRERLAKSEIRHVRQICVAKENSTHGGSEGDYVSFERYIDAVDSAGLPRVYDFVLIDGRARLGAALKVLPYLHDNSVVVVHDTARKRYDGVEKYYEVVDKDVEEANYPRLKNGFMVLRRRGEKSGFSLPLPKADIHSAYSDIADIEA